MLDLFQNGLSLQGNTNDKKQIIERIKNEFYPGMEDDSSEHIYILDTDGGYFDTRDYAIDFMQTLSEEFTSVLIEMNYDLKCEYICGIIILKNGEFLRDEEDSCSSQLAIQLFGEDYIEEFIEDYDDEEE